MTFFTTLFFLGVVDTVERDIVVAEITTPERRAIEEVLIDHGREIRHRVIEIDLPIHIFPCDIREGDVFYITRDVDVTEIRCGEPPE
tara:strand:+ start:199 stop:459 length:261 start_codon:yes stop_codon:yes gene_type:complete